ncbi:hypothetical protein D3C76_1588720 [compost metagenome]
MRFGLNGDRQHLFGDGHLQIHAGVQGLTQDTNVTIGDMTAIFAQMHGNAIGPRLLGDECRLNRIRICRTARVAQGSNVVDVDA